MQKATKFSKLDLILVAVNSIITKLFLIYPSNLIEKGKSASILLSLLIIVIGYFIFFVLQKFCSKSIIALCNNNFKIIVGITFLLVNSIILRSVAESIKLSILPDFKHSITSFLIIFCAAITVMTGLKGIVRSHILIVPVTFVVTALLLAGNISSLNLDNAFPLYGDGIKSFIYAPFFVSFFADYFVVTLLFPYVRDNVKPKVVLGVSFAISALFLLIIVSMILLSGQNNFFIPVFSLAKNFSIFGFNPRLEAVFAAVWLLSVFLNISLYLYYSANLLSFNKSHILAIFFTSVLTFILSFIPKDANMVNIYSNYLSVIKLVVFIIIPVIILFYNKLKKGGGV